MRKAKKYIQSVTWHLLSKKIIHKNLINFYPRLSQIRSIRLVFGRDRNRIWKKNGRIDIDFLVDGPLKIIKKRGPRLSDVKI